MRLVAGVFLAVALAGHSAGAGTFEVDASADVIARRLQTRLPACAVDGLLEADRDNGEWRYTVQIKFDKTWVIEGCVRLDPRGNTTTIGAQVVLIEGGMIFNTERELGAETAEWMERIRLLAAEDPGDSQCTRSRGAQLRAAHSAA
jgi:hypothetical protein